MVGLAVSAVAVQDLPAVRVLRVRPADPSSAVPVGVVEGAQGPGDSRVTVTCQMLLSSLLTRKIMSPGRIWDRFSTGRAEFDALPKIRGLTMGA